MKRKDTMRTNQPLISVIVPVYNVGEFLVPCLDSLLAQTYQNLEILLIDDGSTDASGARCDEYAARDPRFKAIHKENGGVSSARNLGLDIAKGQYIAFVDSDDRVKPDYIEVLYQSIVEMKADIVFCDTEVVDVEGNPVPWISKVKQNRLIDQPGDFLRDIAKQEEGYYAGVWCCLISADVIKDRRFQPLRYGEDSLFMFDLLLTGPRVYLNAYQGYTYVRQPGSVTVNVKAPYRRATDLLKLHSYLYSNLPETPPEVRNTFLTRYAIAVHGVASSAAQFKDRRERRAVRDSLKEHLDNILPQLDRVFGRVRLYIWLYAKMPWLYRGLIRTIETARGIKKT